MCNYGALCVLFWNEVTACADIDKKSLDITRHILNHSIAGVSQRIIYVGWLPHMKHKVYQRTRMSFFFDIFQRSPTWHFESFTSVINAILHMCSPCYLCNTLYICIWQAVFERDSLCGAELFPLTNIWDGTQFNLPGPVTWLLKWGLICALWREV